MKVNLNKFFKAKHDFSKLIINAPEDLLAVVWYILAKIKDRPSHTFGQQQQNFNWTNIFAVMNGDSLFENNLQLILSFKTKPLINDIVYLKQLSQLSSKEKQLIILTNSKSVNNATYFADNFDSILLDINFNELNSLIELFLQEQQLKLTPSALALLHTNNNANAIQLIKDLELLTYFFKPNNVIEAIELQQFLNDNSNYTIFNLSQTYLKGDLSLTLKIFDNIYQEKNELVLIIWIIAEDLRRIIKFKNYQKQQLNLNQILENLKIWGVSAENLTKAVNRINYQLSLELLDHLALLDLKIKGLKFNSSTNFVINDEQLMLKQILKKVCLGN